MQHAAHVFQRDLLPAWCFSQPGNEKFISKFGREVWSNSCFGHKLHLFFLEMISRGIRQTFLSAWCSGKPFVSQSPLRALFELPDPSLQQQYCSGEELLQLLPSNGKIQPPRPHLFILESNKTISCTILLPLGQAASSVCNPSTF